MTIAMAEPEDYDEFWAEIRNAEEALADVDRLERAERIASRVLNNPPPEGLFNDNFDDYYEIEHTDHGAQLRLRIQEGLDRRD